LLYGEGKLKAFRRLREEIIKFSEDETLFAWETPGLFMIHTSSMDVFASDPASFIEARSLVTFASDDPVVPYTMIHRGLRMNVQIFDTHQFDEQIEDLLKNAIHPLRSLDMT
jgi:hypothetical protein